MCICFEDKCHQNLEGVSFPDTTVRICLTWVLGTALSPLQRKNAFNHEASLQPLLYSMFKLGTLSFANPMYLVLSVYG